MLTHQAIRQSFLDFFAEKNHNIVPSASLIPKGDASLLFNNAGMNPFKNIFLGLEKAQSSRVCNAQKCIRLSGKHNDLEEVGKDTYHHAFFEMLGNWSFGDYYKEAAMVWAWELLTEKWNLPRSSLYATVFEEDDEALALWPKVTDLPCDRVFRFGKKDNFWEMGATGPCGPCSEIHMDTGAENCTCSGTENRELCQKPGGGINRDCARYLEIWNLVFIEYNREPDQSLTPLKNKHIDTGMGFERITALLQKKNSNYETDLFMPLINSLAALTGTTYPLRKTELAAQAKNHTATNPNNSINATAIAFRVIVDHIRAISFAIADGVLPSNEGRGYVIRRLIRRAYRYGTTNLACNQPFLHRLVKDVVALMGNHYTELQTEQQFIEKTLLNEETIFHKTLHAGEKRFNHLIEHNLKNQQNTLLGPDLYEIYDTYGFPLDLIKLMAEERNMTIDEAGFETALQEQKSRSRADLTHVKSTLSTILPQLNMPANQYTGEETTQTPGKLQHIILNAVPVTSLPKGTYGTYGTHEQPALKPSNQTESPQLKNSPPDQTAYLIFDKTPFYGESGGQIGDSGWLIDLTKAPAVLPKNQEIPPAMLVAEIIDTKRINDYSFLKIGKVYQPLTTHKNYLLRVNDYRKQAIRKNHSATHLLHQALIAKLDRNIKQHGSLVHNEKLRFDFNYNRPLTPQILHNLETEVRQQIKANLSITISIEAKATALASGAKAFFEEKYGDQVRVVRIGTYSSELCGGSHVQTTSEIGGFKIAHVTSVAAGIKRIEALTGNALLEHYEHETAITQNLQSLLSVATSPRLIPKINALLKENQKLRDLTTTYEKTTIVTTLTEAAEKITPPKSNLPITLYCSHFTNMQESSLTSALDHIKRNHARSIVVVTLKATAGETASQAATSHAYFWVGITKDISTAISAQTILSIIKRYTQGKGGGKHEFAKGATSQAHLLLNNLQNITTTIKKELVAATY
ncbi:alanine--tRNA ligase [Spirochaetota bacterium]|nr:alanine--tRNA ligase [Spirochaetota bacterium]